MMTVTLSSLCRVPEGGGKGIDTEAGNNILFESLFFFHPSKQMSVLSAGLHLYGVQAYRSSF